MVIKQESGAGLTLFSQSSKHVVERGASDRAGYDAIDAYVTQEMRRLNIPGAALAIVAGDEIVHLRGFGQARPGGETPSPLTPFVLGSTTKSFTALAIMQLVEAGKLELDASVQRYLTWFRVADPKASTQITVRHLLHQTSGLPGLPGMTLLAEMDERPDAGERQARTLATLQLAHPVGAAFEYSNLNYNLLGLIIERASGESYADYIQNHIFNPLGMCHSYASQADAKMNNLAVGHRYWFSFPIPARNLLMPRGSLASGQLISCAEDLARYLIAQLKGGCYRNARILSTAGIAELHRGVAEFYGMGKYGMGWVITYVDGIKTVWHGGNVPDFSSFMGLVPEQEKAVVLLVNADHYGLPPIMAEIGLRLTAMLAGRQPAPIRLGMIPWVMRALLLIPLLQCIGVAATLRQLESKHADAAPDSRRKRSSPVQTLVWISNLSLAALPIFLQGKGLLRYLKLFNPDVYWLALLGGGLAGIWSVLRIGLNFRSSNHE